MAFNFMNGRANSGVPCKFKSVKHNKYKAPEVEIQRIKDKKIVIDIVMFVKSLENFKAKRNKI